MGENSHVQPWYFHLKILLYTKYENLPVWTEALIPALALVGLVAGITRRGLGAAHAGLVRFLAFYTVILTAIYAAIPYKTPWLLLGFLHGMTLLAGVGAVVLVRSVPRLPLKILVAVLLLAGVGHLGWQARRANSTFAADQRNPYNYAQTVPDLVAKARRIEELADLSPEGRKVLVQVAAPGSDYWPLPFYLRRLERVGYWDKLPEPLDAPILVLAPQLHAEAAGKLDGYFSEYCGLRPSVQLLLCVRKDLWDAFQARIRARDAASSQQKPGPAAP
jgi:predicted membrane-bound mannosyltransferase